MKGKHLILLLVLLNLSCKVTEKSVVGFYNSWYGHYIRLTIHPDHTFLYKYWNPLPFSDKEIDSNYYITMGKWEISNNKLVLNSFENYVDTNRIRNIIKVPSKTQMSNFSFNDIYDEKISFKKVFQNKTDLMLNQPESYHSHINIESLKKDTLLFNFTIYKPLKFIIQDTTKANYIITVAPYYKQGYFKNQKLTVRPNRIIINKSEKVMRDKSPKGLDQINKSNYF